MQDHPVGRRTAGSDVGRRQAYTVPEAARMFGATRQSLYRAARRGEIRSVRIGERIYLSRVDVDRLIAAVNGRTAPAIEG